MECVFNSLFFKTNYSLKPIHKIHTHTHTVIMHLHIHNVNCLLIREQLSLTLPCPYLKIALVMALQLYVWRWAKMLSSVESGPDVTATAGERYSRGCHLGITTAKIVALATAVGFPAGRWGRKKTFESLAKTVGGSHKMSTHWCKSHKSDIKWICRLIATLCLYV